MEKILITGGMGNLGSWITSYFVKAGMDVYVLTQNERKLEEVSGFNIIQCNISDEQNCIEKLKGFNFSYVIHCASVNDGFVPGYPRLAIEVNAWGTRNILEALKDCGVKNFIYFSTFQVYGKYSGEIDENTALETRNDYGLTHLFGEGYVKQFHFNYKIPYTILRLTNSYGCPKDYNSSKWYLVLNDLAKTAFEQKKIVLKSNGLAPRDFIWMGDVCSTLEKLILSPATNDTFNLAGEKTFKMIDVAKVIQEAYKETYGEEIPLVVNDNDKTEYPVPLFVSAEKLRKQIKYNVSDMFKQEAIKIFKFLEKK